MNVLEIRMLRGGGMMNAVTRKYRIRNVYIKSSIEVVSIKIKENQLRFLGQVLRRQKTKQVKRIYVEGKREKVIPKKRWGFVIESEMMQMDVNKEDVGNRVKWKCKIRAADF